MAGRRKSQKTEYYFDYSLLFIILFLTGFGLVMIYSASAYDATTQNLNEDYYLMHQAFAAALGLVGDVFVSHIPYHFWERFAVIGYVISLILIVLVLSPLGVEVNGARRWLNLGMSIPLCGDRKAGDDSVSGDVYLQDGKKHSDVERLFDGYWSFPAARFVSGKSPTT